MTAEKIVKLRDLKGLGPKSESCLNEIGIHTVAELKHLGAVKTFIALENKGTNKPSLNFLYALVGAIENRDWREVAKTERERLIMELETHKEMHEFFEHKT